MTPLNLDHDAARALHRIVRAMRDGECPKCHSVHPSDKMRFTRSVWRQPDESGWMCPTCHFKIYDDEAEEVFSIFAPFMERNLEVFEKWRAERNTKGPTP